MIRRRLGLIITEQAELMHSAGIFFPKLNVRGALREQYEIKPDSGSGDDDGPKPHGRKGVPGRLARYSRDLSIVLHNGAIVDAGNSCDKWLSSS